LLSGRRTPTDVTFSVSLLSNSPSHLSPSAISATATPQTLQLSSFHHDALSQTPKLDFDMASLSIVIFRSQSFALSAGRTMHLPEEDVGSFAYRAFRR
jgi:hypothetical protein